MWIQISSGNGPDECELGVKLFLKEYQEECKKKGIKLSVIDVVPGNICGDFKSVLLNIDSNCEGDNLISGTILWRCQSIYRPNHKRKNWFINLEVFETSKRLSFSEKEVKFESMKSSGPGGQNVNKVETAVRAMHIPTGLTVVAREERSQIMNKKLALSRLENLIKNMNIEKGLKNKKALWIQHNELERGNPIRVYEGLKFKLKT